MPIKLANNASGTLATAISASDTGIVLTTGDGAEFPTLGAGDYFYATITSSQGTQEIVRVNARSGDSLTVVRAQEGTTAAGFAAGARFELRVTAQSVFDAVGDVVASQVGFTPTGGIAATDVQAALAEVDTEKVAFTRLDDNDGSSLVGFLQAGTNAVPTTAQAKLRETVSVKDFGAVGDGVADDTAAIQAALDAVYAAGGGTLYFPAGEYLVTSIVKVFASNISVKFQGAGKMATVLRKTGASTTPILDLSCTTSPGVTYSPICDMRIQGNAKAHDGIRLTNWARFDIENVYVNACDIGINNRGSLVFIAKDCTIVSNNTGYKADAASAIGANLYEFYGGSISANTTLGVDLGEGTGFSFHLVDFGGNGTSADLNTGAVLIRGTVADGIGVAYGSFSNCWFELNKGTAIRAEKAELNLGFKDTQCISSEGGNAMNIGDIRSLQLINFVAPSAPDTVTVACKNFMTIGGIIGVIVDNSTNTSNVFGTATATAGTGTRARQFNPQIGNSTSYGITPGIVSKQSTAVGNVGAGQDNLMSYSLPANAFSSAGKSLRVTAWGTSANNANAKTVKLFFAGTEIATIALTTSQANAWRLDGDIMWRAGGLATCNIVVTQGGAVTQFNVIATTASAIDATISNTVQVTGEGVADNDVLQRGMLVEYMA